VGLSVGSGLALGVVTFAASDAEQVARSASDIWTTVLDALPRVGIALAVVIVAWALGRATRAGLARALRHGHTASFASVISKLAGWGVIGVGVLLALAVTFPSVKPVDLLAGLGFFSVAVGFAFQDILGNLLAGILLLFGQPFVAGDQIVVGDHEGNVVGITIRETVLDTYDGQRVLIPNADVYKNAVLIQTAHRIRRSCFTVGVAYDTDLDAACRVAVEAVSTVAGVAVDPAPQALLTGLGSSSVGLEIRFWGPSRQLDHLAVLDRSILAVKTAFDAVGVSIPTDIVTVRSASGAVARAGRS
jgi:small-conductance mechanosensitive channel